MVAMVTFGQIAMIATAISPKTLPYLTRISQRGPEGAYEFHQKRTITHGMLVLCGLAKLLGVGRLGIPEFTRLALPLVIHGGALLQVRGEKETAEKIRLLEAARYTMKGA